MVNRTVYLYFTGFATVERPQCDRLNHPLAQRAPEAIQDYLRTEINHGAIASPFNSPAFHPWFHTSPMMVRDKKDFTQSQPASMSLPTPMDLAQATSFHLTLAGPIVNCELTLRRGLCSAWPGTNSIILTSH